MNTKDKYLQDELPKEELEQVTRDLLETKFDEDSRRRFRRALAEEHGIKRPGTGRRRRLYTVLSVAAGVLLIVLSVGLLRQQPNSAMELSGDYLAAHYGSAETRKSLDGADEQRAEAIDAYQLGDFARSAELREEVVAKGSATEEDLFYLALSYLYQPNQNPTAAIRHLQSILALPAPEQRQEAEWFLALAYVRNGQDAAAITLLQKIVNGAQWKKEEAAELLEALEKD